jgi:catechol 2,3-dioxygenase-like lactoylglutathione lyase family enzyme
MWSMLDRPIPISGIDHLGVAVPDLAVAVELFGRIGFVELFRGIAPDGITPVAFIALGDAELELFEAHGASTAMLDHIALRTKNIAAAEQFLEERGVPTAGDQVEAARGRAQRLDSAGTLGLFFHLSER